MRIKLFEEFGDVSYEKFLKLAKKEVDTKRLPAGQFVSVVNMVRQRAGLAKEGNKELPEDLVQACKNAVEDYYGEGVELEFKTDKMYNWWNGISHDSFEFKTSEDRRHANPYTDKDIPFLVWKEGKEPPDKESIS